MQNIILRDKFQVDFKLCYSAVSLCQLLCNFLTSDYNINNKKWGLDKLPNVSTFKLSDFFPVHFLL